MNDVKRVLEEAMKRLLQDNRALVVVIDQDQQVLDVDWKSLEEALTLLLIAKQTAKKEKSHVG